MNQSNENMLQSQTKQFVLDKIHTFQKLKKIDITCIENYDNTLYIGTQESRIEVYQLLQQKQQQIKQSSQHSNSNYKGIQLIDYRHFYPHCDVVHSIVASQKYLIVVPLKGEQLIRIWDRKPLHILHGYKGHSRQISQVIFLKGQKHFASIGYDGTVRIWPLDGEFNNDKQQKKYENKYPILSVIQLNETTVVFGGDDCYITFWNWQDDIVLYRHFAHPGSLSCLSQKYPHILSIGGDSKIKIWQIQEQQASIGSLIAFALLNPIQQFKNHNKLTIKLLKDQIIQANTGHKCFGLRLRRHDLMITDSKGKMLLINMKLCYKTGNLQLQYNQTLNCIKMIKNHIFYVVSKGQRGVLRYRQMNLQNLLAEEEQTDIKGQQIEQPNSRNPLLSMLDL